MTTKVAITLDSNLLQTIDRWVKQGRYPSRSRAIQVALQEKLERWKRIRLSEEAAKLNPKEEQSMAEETFKGETWPKY